MNRSGKFSDKADRSITVPRKRLVFGRKLGRPLSADKKALMDGLLPALSIPLQILTERGDLHPSRFFSREFDEYWLEIGFGNGEHLAALMRQHPATGFIGAEPFINGTANFLAAVKDLPHDNIRVLMDDAMKVACSLADGSMARIYVLNPDPWPKKRHAKRRMIRRENLDEFARLLRPGGLLVMATDVDELAEWMVTQCMQHPAFSWTAERAADWRTAPDWWAKTTRYAEKGLKAGRRQTYLVFEKT